MRRGVLGPKRLAPRAWGWTVSVPDGSSGPKVGPRARGRAAVEGQHITACLTSSIERGDGPQQQEETKGDVIAEKEEDSTNPQERRSTKHQNQTETP